MDIHGEELTLYWRDVHDHLIRQYETVDSLRDLLTGAMDVYLSTVSNRLNNTMKALTVIASIFLSNLISYGVLRHELPVLDLQPGDTNAGLLLRHRNHGDLRGRPDLLLQKTRLALSRLRTQ